MGRVQKITMGSAENSTFFGSQIFWSEFGQNCFKKLVRIRSEFWKFGSEWLSGNTAIGHPVQVQTQFYCQ